MSQREEIAQFFQAVCHDRGLQDKLKAPCPANRRGFTSVAQELGYGFTTVALENYVRFYQFYEEFQGAIERHQSGLEELSDWLKKWHRHIRFLDRTPLEQSCRDVPFEFCCAEPPERLYDYHTNS